MQIALRDVPSPYERTRPRSIRPPTVSLVGLSPVRGAGRDGARCRREAVGAWGVGRGRGIGVPSGRGGGRARGSRGAGQRFGAAGDAPCRLWPHPRVRSSGVERCSYKADVGGSKPSAPTSAKHDEGPGHRYRTGEPGPCSFLSRGSGGEASYQLRARQGCLPALASRKAHGSDRPGGVSRSFPERCQGAPRCRARISPPRATWPPAPSPVTSPPPPACSRSPKLRTPNEQPPPPSDKTISPHRIHDRTGPTCLGSYARHRHAAAVAEGPHCYWNDAVFLTMGLLNCGLTDAGRVYFAASCCQAERDFHNHHGRHRSRRRRPLTASDSVIRLHQPRCRLRACGEAGIRQRV
ncbi:hypothetical protein SPRI_5119 [Streptomyces pristinaespiralis]|uniref:Uncharacterized protein n=1 Tax=Streptomyces pristinaespiralis TaxID=38300 RepID=A0A0M4DVD1_STRPR|nr:hypothetical protein SPRI_5119 [Streptomyces pristinaespiralis]